MTDTSQSTNRALLFLQPFGDAQEPAHPEGGSP